MHLAIYLNTRTVRDNFIILQKLFEPIKYFLQVDNYDYVLYKMKKCFNYSVEKKYKIYFKFVNEEKDIYYLNTIKKSVFNNFISLTSKKINKYQIETTLDKLSFETLLRLISKTNELSRNSLNLQTD